MLQHRTFFLFVQPENMNPVHGLLWRKAEGAPGHLVVKDNGRNYQRPLQAATAEIIGCPRA